MKIARAGVVIVAENGNLRAEGFCFEPSTPEEAMQEPNPDEVARLILAWTVSQVRTMQMRAVKATGGN